MKRREFLTLASSSLSVGHSCRADEDASVSPHSAADASRGHPQSAASDYGTRRGRAGVSWLAQREAADQRKHDERRAAAARVLAAGSYRARLPLYILHACKRERQVERQRHRSRARFEQFGTRVEELRLPLLAKLRKKIL